MYWELLRIPFGRIPPEMVLSKDGSIPDCVQNPVPTPTDESVSRATSDSLRNKRDGPETSSSKLICEIEPAVVKIHI